MELLKWFKGFHTAGVKDEEYDPVKARHSSGIRPLLQQPGKNLHGFKNVAEDAAAAVIFSFTPSAKSQFKKATEQNGAAATRSFGYQEEWKDRFEWANRSILGGKYTYCHHCDKNLSTHSRGLKDLERHQMTNKHRRRSQNPGNRDSGPLSCSHVAVGFVSEYCEAASAPGEEASTDLARRKLGPRHRSHVASACQQAPYCVYVYGGVPVKSLEEDGTVSVVLVGFFHVEANRHCVRFLDAFRSAAEGGDEDAAAVVKILKDFKLPKENLVAVYSEGHAESSEQILLLLRELNPNLVALDGLYTVADSACRAGLKGLSTQVQELLADIYAHFSSRPAKNHKLEALFGSDVSKDSQTFPLNTSCLKFCSVVSKTLEMWSELLLYFKSCSKNDEKVELICSRMQDNKVRATFMFLEQALKPLCRFQRRLQTREEAAGARLQLILEEATKLLCTYTSFFLRPQAALHFLKAQNSQILQSEKFHLPSLDLSVGEQALEEFLNKSVAKDATALLKQTALSFYTAVTRCLAETLPLSQRARQSIAQLLKPHSWLSVARAAVGKLGAELGICSSAEDAAQLAEELLQQQLLPAREEEEEEEDSLEKHWASLLKEARPGSRFRRLLLTLLAFPCPPLEPEILFSKVTLKEWIWAHVFSVTFVCAVHRVNVSDFRLWMMRRLSCPLRATPQQEPDVIWVHPSATAAERTCFNTNVRKKIFIHLQTISCSG